MGAEIHDLRDCEVSTAVAREELERLLDDPRFRVTARQRDILKYLAERRFDGYDGNVKAYAIALDVLGRPSGFDAANDPIVRIEISRLRLVPLCDGFVRRNVKTTDPAVVFECVAMMKTNEATVNR